MPKEVQTEQTPTRPVFNIQGYAAEDRIRAVAHAHLQGMLVAEFVKTAIEEYIERHPHPQQPK